MNKPFYKKQWFVISAIIFSLCVLQVFYSLNPETASTQTQTYIPPTHQVLQTATTTATTTEKVDFDALLKNLQKGVPSTKTLPIQNIPQENSNTADIVAEWQDRVAKVNCLFNEGQTSMSAQGSATLATLKDVDGSYIPVAITNAHVLSDNGYTTGGCLIGIYGKGSRIVSTPGAILIGTKEDYGYINLDKASTVSETTWKSVLSKPMAYCSESDVRKGDDLILLGYPAIGSADGLTITKGIVAGIEKDYFVTDAKIDHGNSGGAAILIKNDCYLGIPSASVQGSLESMGRILKNNFVIKS